MIILYASPLYFQCTIIYIRLIKNLTILLFDINIEGKYFTVEKKGILLFFNEKKICDTCMLLET